MRSIYLSSFLVLTSVMAAISQNVSYTALYDHSSFNSHAILTNLPVGSTPGAGNVSGSGGATYSIPITVAPGTNAVSPSVSLEYNSQSGSGIAGMGWNLSGLSAITRMPKNVYFDGVAGPVELSTNDRFAMDGSRLIVKNGTYGTASSTYGTEVEDFSVVTALGTQGNGPLSFEVLTKDGVKIEYGNTADSRFMSQTTNTVMFWRINKLIYPDGNYIEYVYTDTSIERDSRISEIRYTGNTLTGQAPYNKIEFSYKIRQEASPGTFSDIRTSYEAGSSILSKYLLDLITVKAEGAVVKKYQLGYGHDQINSYLKSVTEFGSDNSQLNPTIFKYGDAPMEVTNASTNIESAANIITISGDYDGDGKDEILSAYQAHTTDNIPYFANFTIYKANATGSEYSQLAYQSLPNNHTIVSETKIPNSKNFIPNDYTGDGRDDILTLNISYNGTESKLENITIYESINGGTAFVPHIRTVQPNYYRIHPNNKFFYPGDFDGDGISEYLTILGNVLGKYSPYLCTNYMTGGSCASISISGAKAYSEDSWYDSDKIVTLDFNGDGKTDLMLVKNNVYEIYTFTGPVATRLSTGTFSVSNSYLYLGDFNGDGKTDLIQASPDFSSVHKDISTGSNFSQNVLTLVQPWPMSQPVIDQSDKITVGDFNGDGKSDFHYRWRRIMRYPNSKGYDIHTYDGTDIYYSQGDSFKYKQLTFDLRVEVGYGNPSITVPSIITYVDEAPMDLNGDGRTDLVSSGGKRMTYKLFNKDGKENLIHKVANGLNHITEWNYKSLVGNGPFYLRGSGASSYPLNVIQPALILVSEFKAPNGIGGTSSVQYSYEEAWLHRAGKGFLGFKYIYSHDLALGMRTIIENQLNTTFYTALPYKSATYLGISSILLSTNALTNSIISPSPKRFWVKTTALLENDFVTGRSINTTNTYDDGNGNITYSKMDVNAGVEVTETTTIYGAFPGTILNKPIAVSIAKTRGGQLPAYSTITTFGYNGIGQLTSKTELSGTSKAVTTSYGYNAMGNLSSTTLSPSGMAARTSWTTFDSKGRYAVSTANALGQGSSATYDAKWGKPLTTTGIDGLTTSTTYDGFGRTTTTTYPGPYTGHQSYVWDDAHGAVWRTDLTFPSQGKPDSKTWYDLLGRQIWTETEGFDGTIIQSQTYDTKGNVRTSTQPYKSGESYISTTNHYQPNYNWLVSIEQGPLGTTSLTHSYSAGALTLTTASPTGTTSKITDASGKVTSATDNGGTLTYSYYNHGGLKEVKNSGITLTNIEYDEAGRQTKLMDANAGTTTYVYDALGQLTSQTSAKGETHTMAYNLLGQVTSRSGPEGTTTYSYGTSNSGGDFKNQVKQITGFVPGNQNNYTYDALGRVAKIIEKIDYTDHTSTYSYNNFGDLLTTTYPSTLAVTNVYDTNGYLSKIQSGGTDIYSTGSINGQGQVTTYSLGNGRSSTNTYVNGFPTRFETSGIQDLRMVWDFQKGNLTSRYDARTVVNKTESFTYDNLNRLTSTIFGGQASHTINYSGNGNITNKTDAGTYSYHPTKLNAITGVSNPATVIPSQQQDITYTAFQQPLSITEGNYNVSYAYGADYNRIKSVLKQSGNTINTRYYFDGFEKEVTVSDTRYIQYIASPTGLAAIIVSTGGGHVTHYTYTDHLGSIVTVTNGSGMVEAEQSFDAWGRRRHSSTWASLAPTAATGLPAWPGRPRYPAAIRAMKCWTTSGLLT